KPFFWLNPAYQPGARAGGRLTKTDIQDAADRLTRFAPLIKELFPETAPAAGLIESPLLPIPKMQTALLANVEEAGRYWLKGDHLLPISGSIKARGGIYEVLKHAERLAIEHRLLRIEDDYRLLADLECKSLFRRHSIAVGSTGNLGLSIGIMGATLGFKVTVHMSADAKTWKKDLLKNKGVEVIEYRSDYSQAVTEGRAMAMADPQCHFIDDEKSKDLFLGYAVAALRLKKHLDAIGLGVNREHPLFVYLPCGVGGGPGGVAFGLKSVFGPHVHPFFAEPTHAPSMLLGMMTGLHEQIAVQDIGLDNRTEADGLAVGRPSGFVGRLIEPLLAGIFTVEDRELYRLLALLKDTEGISLEPSALAGMPGPRWLLNSPAGKSFLNKYDLQKNMSGANHIVWATGGSMVPLEEMKNYYKQGLASGLGDEKIKR
ncbi:MAG: D-serine ammonia-lyase, partial [Geopsychrobacter sp.]|nr:D-serine ammonia-lyase [Geopsychrobacter sp.]